MMITKRVHTPFFRLCKLKMSAEDKIELEMSNEKPQQWPDLNRVIRLWAIFCLMYCDQ